ncbi:MAG: hypothetical protein IKI67_08355 [Bacteroidales bacterium]|nr:hypothetical protein [Bacteroidales bacterium]
MFFLFKKKRIGAAFLKEATDVHCHILPGVDDGMQDLSESLELLAVEATAGVKRIYLTPHSMGAEGAAVDSLSYRDSHSHKRHDKTEVSAEKAVADPDNKTLVSSVDIIAAYQKEYTTLIGQSKYNSEPKGGFSNEHLKEQFALFKKFYDGNIELHLAAEYMMNKELLNKINNKDLLTYSDSVHVLVETSYIAPPIEMDEILYNLSLNGYKPIIAHPERYRYMSEGDYKKLKDRGYELQLNYLALTGCYGKEVYERAIHLLDKKMYDFAGSDFHRISTFYHRVGSLKLNTDRTDKLLALFSNNNNI